MRCKFWKDSVWFSANQKRAWSTRKRIENRIKRRRANRLAQKEYDEQDDG
jgi:hypothetical protein